MFNFSGPQIPQAFVKNNLLEKRMSLSAVSILKMYNFLENGKDTKYVRKISIQLDAIRDDLSIHVFDFLFYQYGKLGNNNIELTITSTNEYVASAFGSSIISNYLKGKRKVKIDFEKYIEIYEKTSILMDNSIRFYIDSDELKHNKNVVINDIIQNVLDRTGDESLYNKFNQIVGESIDNFSRYNGKIVISFTMLEFENVNTMAFVIFSPNGTKFYNEFDKFVYQTTKNEDLKKKFSSVLKLFEDYGENIANIEAVKMLLLQMDGVSSKEDLKPGEQEFDGIGLSEIALEISDSLDEKSNNLSDCYTYIMSYNTIVPLVYFERNSDLEFHNAISKCSKSVLTLPGVAYNIHYKWSNNGK